MLLEMRGEDPAPEGLRQGTSGQGADARVLPRGHRRPGEGPWTVLSRGPVSDEAGLGWGRKGRDQRRESPS